MSVHAIMTVTQSHIIYPGNSLVGSLFSLDQLQCSSIGTTIVNCFTCIIPFQSLYQSKQHFGIDNSLELISPFYCNLKMAVRSSLQDDLFFLINCCLILLSSNGLLSSLGQSDHCVQQLQQWATPHTWVNMSWYGSLGEPLSISNQLHDLTSFIDFLIHEMLLTCIPRLLPTLFNYQNLT